MDLFFSVYWFKVELKVQNNTHCKDSKIYANMPGAGVDLNKRVNIRHTPCKRQLLMGWVLSLLLYGALAYGGTVKEIADGIYLRAGVHEVFSKSNQGHISNIGFIVGTERVAVIDTGSSYQEGLALRKMITAVTDLPIEYVILTHMHPDHALGAAAFTQDNPLFIGHQQLADALTRRQSIYRQNMSRLLGSGAEGTKIVLPNKKVEINQGLKLNLGGRTLQLRAYPTAHTNNDLSVYDDKTATLWLSDLLFVQRVPVVDGSLLGWLKVMDDLLSSSCFIATAADNEPGVDEGLGEPDGCGKVDRVVPGHGPVVTDWRRALINQRRYLDLMATGIREVIKRGGDIAQAVESVGREERSNWLLFNEYHGRNITAAFAELEWE
jgi:quinoprotein relay system zinc metallohydrolase 2